MSESQTVLLQSGGIVPESAVRFARELLLRDGAWLDHTVICLSEPESDVVLTYRELRKRAETAAANLQAMGIGCGDTVCVAVQQREAFLTAFWGVVLSGAAAIPLEHTAFGEQQEAAERERMASILDIAHPKAVLTDWLTRIAGTPMYSVEELLTGASNRWIPQPLDDEHVMMILFTSGSTGQPKGVPITERMLRANLAGHAAAFPFSSNDRFFNWMPLDHSAAMVQSHLLAVYVQASQVQAPTGIILSEPSRWMQLASRLGVTVSWAPNFAYGLASANIEVQNTPDLSHLRCLFSAGETVTRTACERFERQWAAYGLREDVIRVGWGMTETAGYILTSSGWKNNPHIGTVCSTGTPIAGISIGVRYQENGRGELLVRGDTVAKSYLGAQDEMCCDEEGWLHSGDEICAQGDDFVIVGRQKDIFILNGRNIACAEIEARILEALPDYCSQVICTAMQDVDSGRENLCVFAVAADERKAEFCRELRRVLITQFGCSYDTLVFAAQEQIPRTGVGKIRRKALGRLLTDGVLTPYIEQECACGADDLCQRREQVEKMLALWQSVLANPELGVQDNFFLSGGFSAQIPRLLTKIERTFGRTIHATDILNAPTVESLTAELFADSPQAVEETADDILCDMDILDI